MKASVNDDAAETVISPVGFVFAGTDADAPGLTNTGATSATMTGTMTRNLLRTNTSSLMSPVDEGDPHLVFLRLFAVVWRCPVPCARVPVMATTESPVLSLTDWVVLGVLAEEPRHGFAVAKELGRDAELGQLWTVRRPLVYRAIDHLLEIGFAESRFVEPGDQGPHRTVIAPTRVGRARLRRWLDEPVEHPRDVRATLLVKLALRARRGDTLAPLARVVSSTPSPTCTEGSDGGAGPTSSVAQLAITWRYQANEAIRRFLEALIRDEDRVPRRSSPTRSGG